MVFIISSVVSHIGQRERRFGLDLEISSNRVPDWYEDSSIRESIRRAVRTLCPSSRRSFMAFGNERNHSLMIQRSFTIVSCMVPDFLAHSSRFFLTRDQGRSSRWFPTIFVDERSVALVHCVDRSWCSSTTEMIRWASWDHWPSASRLPRIFIHKRVQLWWIEWLIPIVTVVIGDVRLSERRKISLRGIELSSISYSLGLLEESDGWFSFQSPRSIWWSCFGIEFINRGRKGLIMRVLTALIGSVSGGIQAK